MSGAPPACRNQCQGVTVLGDGARINTGLVVPHRKRPGRPLLEGEEADNAEHRRVRARVEHAFAGMKRYKILRDCPTVRRRPPPRGPSRRPHAQPRPGRVIRTLSIGP
ncbi:hypothetical protein JCM4814A_80850 [Streptomyces phaeofaciens JCM 4814]|uniref:DDE Tnp4 domain-containing protein n=1 Tax=Streptomyces phaeofaciens TaxID=68254 RepID=A0A918M0V3_9ACTN|nr:hypothetical protein GCM10010226_86470 [Streptomyces phaeofaciens]